MNYFESLVLGALQGLTEFLPVSSSGHLFLTEKFFGLTQSLPLEVTLHVGSLIAVVVFFWEKIIKLVRGIFLKNADGIFAWKLLLATFMTVPVALFINKFVSQNYSFHFVAVMFLFTALFIFIAEKFRPKKESFFTWKMAAFLGLVQGVAVFPALSRSGTTIAFLILMGIARQKAAETSFLLVIPTIFGALVFAIHDAGGVSFLSQPQIWVGFIASAIVSWLAIQWMLKLVQKQWIWFSLYCAMLGVGLLIFA